MKAMKSRVRNRSLMARLVRHFLLLSLVIVALAGLVAFLRARAALEDSVFERLRVLAALGEEQLQRWIAERRRDVVFLASLPEVRARSEVLLATVSESPPVAPKDEPLREVLEAAAAPGSDLEVIFVLSSRGGRIVLSTDAAHEGEYRIRDSFFTRGLRGTFVQNVYPSPVTFAPQWTISTPLTSRHGTTVGVLAAHLDLEELDRVLALRSGLGRSGEIYLVDRYNAFVSGTRFGRDRFPRGVRSPGIDTALAGVDGSGLYRNYENRPVIGAYRWIDELELALVVEIAQAEAFLPARRMAAVLVGFGVLVAMALAAGTYVLARRITRPLGKVTQAVVRVSGGDLEARAPVLSGDEIGVLAGAFNEMTRRLARTYESLRREIDERRRTQDELEAKNAELERYTYSVSHDLKSPLVTIQGFVGLLERGLETADAERVRADLAQIRTAADTMSRLLNELLELSRIGRIANPPEDIDLVELVAEARDSLGGAISQSGARVEIAGDLGRVRGDRTRLLEVYQNLLDNALKFLRGVDEPAIQIGVRRGREEPVYYVCDNGPGIEPRYHEKIFGLFERLDARVEGTGVGLTLVQRIVEVHGGRIWVESEGNGRGAAFCWTLPGEATAAS